MTPKDREAVREQLARVIHDHISRRAVKGHPDAHSTYTSFDTASDICRTIDFSLADMMLALLTRNQEAMRERCADTQYWHDDAAKIRALPIEIVVEDPGTPGA